MIKGRAEGFRGDVKEPDAGGGNLIGGGDKGGLAAVPEARYKYAGRGFGRTRELSGSRSLVFY
eukprot:1350139-Amorphochlora_amoeboformis.AAC.1